MSIRSLTTLTVVTALLAIIAGSTPGNHFLQLRWWIYEAFLLIVVASIQISYSIKSSKPEPIGNPAESRRGIPFPEILSATIAAAAWGLVTPGSALQALLKGQTAMVTAACITIGGATLVSLIAPTLTQGSRTPKNPKAAKG
jgi:hypothetical protein